jgi:1-acyl-sn-glycerol-3-phosphate acyltransferase
MRRRAPGERLYRTLVILGTPLRSWCRLEVHGVDQLRAPGGVLLVANHDSYLDPLALGEAAMRVRRPLRFLARANLWRLWPVRAVLDGIRQIPIQRGTGDVAALEQAVNALRAGEAVCIFPEGTISRGERLRARRGVARLAQAAPDARIVLAAVRGGVDLVRVPRRPRVVVELFAPRTGQASPHEDQAELAGRLLGEIRDRVPPAAGGRHANP